MKLYVDGKEAVKGMEVTTFRGEKAILKSWREPHKPGSTGRVYIRFEGDSSEMEYFHGVIRAEFREE